MRLDSTFASEVRRVANGDGTREHARELSKELKTIAKALSHRYQFDEVLKEYGRAKVALCIAATISTQHSYELRQHQWANAVLMLWCNRIGSSVERATVNIHPAILADVSNGLRGLTTEEAQER